MSKRFVCRVLAPSLFSFSLAVLALNPALVGQGLPSQDCWSGEVAAGALPGQPEPVFCSIDQQGASTASIGANRWSDEFEAGITQLDFEVGFPEWQDFSAGLRFADFQDLPYVLFDDLSVSQSIHWRHASHWMVDIAPDERTGVGGAIGAAMIRPDASFRFEEGRFVAETDFAAAHPDYGDKAWGEILVTTSPLPSQQRRHDGPYGYDRFPGHYALGCRLQADRHAICSLMDNSPLEVATFDARLWEISFFQVEGTEVYGGFPAADEVHFRQCQPGEGDGRCRDRFRMELTPTSLSLWVNGSLYFQQKGLPRLPEALLNGELFVYFASVVSTHASDVVRFHWDRIAVNPPGPATASDTF